nr:flagellar motor switch protein FliG [Roseburia sp. AM59-24XD]
MAKSEEISGIQKAAILLIALGPDKSSSVFKHLKEDEIEQITLEIANTRSVSPAVKDKVMDEFYEVCLAQQYIAEGGIGYAKDLLEKALGAERARDVIGKLTASLQVRPFEFVRKTDASQLLNFIQDEHPQTIALILSYLSSAQASVIISALSPDKQTDVAKRIAQMDRTSPDVIKEVEKVLEQKLASLVNQDYTIVGGVDAIVDILNTVDRGTEKHIMESMEIEDPELADEIRKKMFVFEDILSLDDRSVQRVLREVDNNELAVALKGSNEEVQNLIFGNLSKRLATMIKEDMEFMGPVRMKDVEEAQQKIVNIIRKLEIPGRSSFPEVEVTRSLSNLIKSVYFQMDQDDTRVINSDDHVVQFAPELLQQVEASSVNDPEETEPVGEFQQGMNVLNMEDVREEERARVQEETSLEMESMLADARAQAEEILQNAREQADEIRQQAQEEGRNAGFEQGQAEALKHLQEEALRQQEQFEQQQQKLKEQEEALEPKYAELMGALIEKITGVLCEDKKDVIVYLIHQALNQLEKTKSVTLRVSKPDMLTVSAQKEQLRSCVSGEVDFDITEDDSLQENQCIIETDQRIIDCSLDVQLQNLKDQIRMLTIM